MPNQAMKVSGKLDLTQASLKSHPRPEAAGSDRGKPHRCGRPLTPSEAGCDVEQNLSVALQHNKPTTHPSFWTAHNA